MEVEGGVVQLGDRTGPAHPRVVDDHVDPAELVERAAHDRSGPVERRHVGVVGSRPPAGQLDGVDGGAGEVEVVDDDRRARSCEREGVRPAESAPRAGDHGDLALEERHGRRVDHSPEPAATSGRRASGARPSPSRAIVPHFQEAGPVTPQSVTSPSAAGIVNATSPSTTVCGTTAPSTQATASAADTPGGGATSIVTPPPEIRT